MLNGREQGRRLRCCTVTSTAENPTLFSMYWQQAHYAVLLLLVALRT